MSGPSAGTRWSHASAGSTARSILEQHGPLGLVIGTIYASLTRRYLAMESAGLKERCEQT